MSIQVRSNEPVVPETKAVPEHVEGEPKAHLNESAPDQESVQKESKESDTLETVAKEEGISEEHHDESEHDSDHSDESEKDKTRKKGGFQRRIDKLNSRVSAAQQEVEYWKQQALKGASESKQETKVDHATQASQGKPDPAKFDSHSEYVEALTDWKTEQKLMEREQRQEQQKLQSEQQKLVKEHHDREKSFAAKVSDYAEALEEVNAFRDASPTLAQIIVSSENGPELMYELAKNKEEYYRINNLPPIAQARALGHIESKLSSKPSEQKVESKKLTNAPRPIAPVGAGGKGSVPKSIYDPALSQSEYERIRREQVKRANS